MAYWCAGMYASGSTWTYNVMRAIARHAHPGETLSSHFVNDIGELAFLGRPGGPHVVKSHDLPADAAELLARHARCIVVTQRDPRDAVTSLMLYQRFPFNTALQWVGRSARFAAALAERPGTVMLRYEDGFVDDPATIDRLAAAMGGRLPPRLRDELFAQTRRASIERLIAALPGKPDTRRTAGDDIMDSETQWHGHHAGRSGEIGRWRHMLAPAQLAWVEQELGAWMEVVGYVRATGASSGYAGGLVGFDPFLAARRAR
ncbi:MAG: hypothetical protein KGJ41_03355 [Rhodospirillales bacterium]|nr:hypothetical protein [Rhodospirillales bacterium]